MADADVFVIDGTERKMGRLPPDEAARLMRASMTSFSTYLQSKGKDLIPRSLWKPIDRRTVLGPQFINDQQQWGACVGASCVQAAMRVRALAGMMFHTLSWGYVYDQINGGQDNGAIITHSMKVMEDLGAPIIEEYPIPKFNRKTQPQSMRRFRLSSALTLSTFDEIGTALQMGGIVQFPVMVGRNFGQFDGDGVCGFTRGGGNHSVHADGMKQRSNGAWLLDMPNSWTVRWGPSGNGRAFLSEEHIDGCDVNDDAYVHFDFQLDPEDPNNPPMT